MSAFDPLLAKSDESECGQKPQMHTSSVAAADEIIRRLNASLQSSRYKWWPTSVGIHTRARVNITTHTGVEFDGAVATRRNIIILFIINK